MSSEDLPTVLLTYTKCINFAAVKHRNQRRLDSDKTPYINHPIGVAHILTSEGGVTDFEVLQAAILHDTVEDTDTSFEEIEQNFGFTVRRLVQEVTDDKSLPKLERKRLQIEHAAGTSPRARLIKLADKIYNLRDLQRCQPEGWTVERCREYFIWAKKVCDNLKGTNQALEDILDEIFRHENVA
ncbi:guanosine-3',5'-bis(diphosphate) 3'-pyrophosphohydrolase MESH1 [Malaya genurostris]|uniref:guanosine-3',5'-bis(diphosphate) 3'-pyrophosphohydrolase MESH1 n=1 Tax=Malaya genurostris TaxID=325434 RepID=UPI0026F3AA58|nr:guanosine-3',5'-bis(diphosphate) 3'-pyrophosphohydrolase MESH1 [Malaya genurostris]XP_058461409.1 guanosine-3',5'-bis(diphosphate) 3'-pyrophosphohydrolase MESH1 [Malaya genurostris]XP_058461416.1 guanosine-3',5'-bis(diphosphate) 3'-pyrophosphohydrolase MESH1 [Malaya genurostris]